MAVSTLEVLITGDATGLTRSLSQAVASVAKTEAAVKSTTSSASSSVSKLSSGFKTLAPAFIAIGAGAVVAITKGITATQDWAAQIRVLQRVTGEGADATSALAGAASLLNLDTTKLNTGFGILSKNIVNGAQGLTKYGITVRDAQGQVLPFSEVLGNIQDKFATLKPGAEQAAFAMNVFGRSGKELIPILARGREGLAELEQKAKDAGLVMSQEDVDAAKELSIAQHGLSDAVQGASISIGKSFIPAATRMVEVVSQGVELFTKIPAPVKTAALSIAVLTGALSALQFVGSFFSRTWSGVIGLFTGTGAAGKVAATGLETAGASATITSEQVTVLTGVLQGLASSLGVEIPVAAAKGAEGLVGFGVAESGLIVPTNELAAANARLAGSQAGLGAGAVFGQAAGAGFKFFSGALTVATGAIARIIPPLAAMLVIYKTLGANTVPTAEGLQAVNKAVLDAQSSQLALANGGKDLNGVQIDTISNLQGSVEMFKQQAIAAGADARAVNIAVDRNITYADALAIVNQNANDSRSALDGASEGAQNLATATSDAKPLLDEMGTSFNDLAAGAETAFTTAQQQGKDTTAALQAYADQQVAAAQQARQAFQDQAKAALSFTTSMLSDLQATAQQASDTLAGDTSDLSASALENLRKQANVTATDILHTFQAAGDQTKSFGQDLLELSHIGGQAGKDLARSLLESGDVMSAQLIADAPAQLQRQIVNSFRRQETAADKLSGKLTTSIVGPLKDIKNVLIALAKQVFGVTLDYKDDGAQKKVDKLTHTTNDLVTNPHTLTIIGNTHAAQHQLDTLSTDVDHLVGTEHRVNILLHTGTGSPWPDEAIKQHLLDPVKAVGGKMIGGRMTLPLDVSIHAALSKTGPTKAELEARQAWFADALTFASQDAPRLPRGHTNISVNHHERRRHEVVLDRKRFTDAASYDIDYSRGF